jgi:tetratricopeptide (TPR) repeat protein
MRRLAYERAADYFGRAIEAATQGDIGAERRIELVLARGDALLASNDLAGARDQFVEAADASRAIGDPEALARAALGFAAGLGGFEVRMFDSAQISLLDEALDGLPAGDSGLRALLLARRSVAGSFLESIDEREQLASSAVAVARRANDRHALSHALAAQCDAAAGPDWVDERVAAASEAMEVARRTRDVAQELLARRLLVVADLERGELTGAWREADAFSRAAGRLRQPLYSLYGSVWRGCRAMVEGRLDQCLSAAEETDDLAGWAGSVNGRIQAWVARILVHAHRRDYAALHAAWYPMVASTPDLGPSPTIVWHAVAQLAGDSSVSKPTVDDVVALPKDGQWLGALCWLARAAADGHDAELAAAVYEQLRRYEHLVAVQGVGAGCHGSVAHWLGQLAAATGDRGAAAAHLETAVRIHRRAGMPLLLAESLAALAAVDGHDAARAEAVALYRGMGLDELGPAPPTHVAAGSSAPSFHRAGDIWTVRFAERTTQLRDSKGVRDIAWLVGQPGRDVHVTELLAATEGTTPARAPARAAASEPVLDEQARTAYRARITELEAEIDDADAANDLERVARARAELDFLLDELTAATGLGGRSRAMTDDAERARKAVSWRIRDALRKVTRLDPELGRHLTEHITTGAFCSYRPRGR